MLHCNEYSPILTFVAFADDAHRERTIVASTDLKSCS